MLVSNSEDSEEDVDGIIKQITKEFIQNRKHKQRSYIPEKKGGGKDIASALEEVDVDLAVAAEIALQKSKSRSHKRRRFSRD